MPYLSLDQSLDAFLSLSLDQGEGGTVSRPGSLA